MSSSRSASAATSAVTAASVSASDPTNATAPAWLAAPALSRLWTAARVRLERRHLEPTGRMVLADLSREERHAVGALLARPVIADRVTVDLAEVDEVLARRSPYRGLAEAVVALTGAPLRDRRAERSAVAAARETPLSLARELLAASVSDAAWGEAWLAGVRRSGLLTRAGDPVAVVHYAVEVLAAVLPAARPTVSRADLAARITGGAHGLDDGMILSQLVLRALALDADLDAPADAESRRGLWARYGVSVDSVSTTCLTLGLAADGDHSTARRLRVAADAGDPMHLTPRDLRGLAFAAARAGDVLVCENPRVLEAMADRFGGAVRVVCTAGQPALVVLDVLRRLAAAGSALHYHGDFDWPGIAIANRLVGEVGVVPWRMTSADYLAAVRHGPATLSLEGAPVAASWDDTLAAAMTRAGVAVHEEAVLDDLLNSAAATAPAG